MKGVLSDLPGRAEREPVVAHGEGGDDTTAIDAAAERVILKRFEGLDVTIVSEEVGEYGDGRWRVVVDPIDGSLNAKRGIPFFSLSIASPTAPRCRTWCSATSTTSAPARSGRRRAAAARS